MRRLLPCLVVALVAGSCGDVAGDPSPERSLNQISIRESPSPYRYVAAGPVSAVIPDTWQPKVAGMSDRFRHGILAGPGPTAWETGRTPSEGLAAMWVDGTAVGVPSDYYYLAATRTAVDLITGSKRCSATSEHVIVDHVPAYARGEPDSPGDFVARGNGTCLVRDTVTHWAYFVAAPGYGPVREVGIPSSGLYVVVALVPDSPRASFVLNRLLERTRFNGASVADMIAVAEPTVFPVLGPI